MDSQNLPLQKGRREREKKRKNERIENKKRIFGLRKWENKKKEQKNRIRIEEGNKNRIKIEGE